jgi:glycosyltransferase involved in cell wall biosynthesis
VATVLLDVTALRTDVRLYGIGRYAGDLARGLGRRGGSPRVVALTAAPLFGAPGLADEPGEAAAALARATSFESPSRWAWHARLGMARAARAAGAALVHSPHAGATPLGLGCPRLVTCHDLIPLRFPEHYLPRRGVARGARRAVEWRRYRGADHVVAISRATADDLVALLGVAPGRISVVHSGIELGRWSPAPVESDDAALERLGVARLRFALHVGGDDWRKNLSGMLRALAGQRELALVWAGRPAPRRRAAILALARELGVEERFRVLGHVSDEELGALYRRALCLLFVSRYEGFGYPLVEAMAAGCPVVSSGAASLGEIAGDAALVVDPESPPAIAAALAELARDEGARSELRSAGLRRARAFSLEAMAQGTADVYERLVGR